MKSPGWFRVSLRQLSGHFKTIQFIVAMGKPYHGNDEQRGRASCWGKRTQKAGADGQLSVSTLDLADEQWIQLYHWKGRPSRTFMIYRTVEVPQSRTRCNSTRSEVAMVTMDMLQESRSWSTYCLRKIKILEARSRTSRRLLLSIPMVGLWALSFTTRYHIKKRLTKRK